MKSTTHYVIQRFLAVFPISAEVHHMKNQRGYGQTNVLGTIAVVILVAFLLLGGIGGCMWIWPKYNVYAKDMSGQAQLAEAQSNRRIAVEEAMALKDSAQHKADAEIIRARGVAEANIIIGDSLKGNHEYLRYLYIDMLAGTNNQLIYVPTEGGLPVLEASRLAPRAQSLPAE